MNRCLCVVAGIVLAVSASTAGQNTNPGQEPQPGVEIQYCGVRPAKPPLKLLSFNIRVSNQSGKPQWFLFPRALYEKASEPGKQAGVNGVEIFSNQRGPRVTVAQFLGSIRLQPESAGGFQALLLPPGARVSIRDFGIEFWGDNFSPLPLHIVIADHVNIGKTPADHWAGPGVNFLSAKSADVSTQQITMVRSRFARRRSEIAVTIEKSGEITVPDVLAKSCEKTN